MVSQRTDFCFVEPVSWESSVHILDFCLDFGFGNQQCCYNHAIKKKKKTKKELKREREREYNRPSCFLI